MKKILPSFYALIFGAGLIAFSLWYILFFRNSELMKEQKGTPGNFGLTEKVNSEKDGKPRLPYYFIQLKDNTATFVLRMYGEDFNFLKMDSLLASGEETLIRYYPLPNENNQFEVYQVLQQGKLVYNFNKRFNPSSSRGFGWVLFVSGTVVFFFGILSLYTRGKKTMTDL